MTDNTFADIEGYLKIHPDKYEPFAILRNNAWYYVFNKLDIKEGKTYNGPIDARYISLKAFYLLQNYAGTTCKSYTPIFKDLFKLGNDQYDSSTLYAEILNVIEDFKTTYINNECIAAYIDCLNYGYRREVELNNI